MRFDFLREPISEASPCGPDLDLEMDADYTNYMLLASGRLPSSFFDSRTGAPFDRSSIDLAAEVKTIREFLDQTRDARLITLDLRFHALRGDLTGFSEALQGLAILSSTFWNDFHPQLEDGDIIFRMNAVEAVDDQVQVVLPLQFSSLTGSGRSAAVTLRNYLVASGQAPAREGEEGPSLDQINQILGDERQAENLTNSHETILAAQTAIAEIRSQFLTNAGSMPNFDRVIDVLKQMDAVIVKFRPELGGTAGAEEEEFDEDEEGEAPAGGSAPRRRTQQLGLVKTHGHANDALKAVEKYLMKYEPSSPSMVLVHQARMLVGKPMVDVFDTLLPDNASYASFKFIAGTPFSINFNSMRQVIANAIESGLLDELDEDEPEPPAPPPPPPPEPEPEVEPEPEPMDESGEESQSDAMGADGEQSATSSDEAPRDEPVEPEPQPEPEPPPPPAPVEAPSFRARTRDDAGALLQEVETFFRTVEPSSPIPLLLTKARNYFSKDFAAILSELLPPET